MSASSAKAHYRYCKDFHTLAYRYYDLDNTVATINTTERLDPEVMEGVFERIDFLLRAAAVYTDSLTDLMANPEVQQSVKNQASYIATVVKAWTDKARMCETVLRRVLVAQDDTHIDDTLAVLDQMVEDYESAYDEEWDDDEDEDSGWGDEEDESEDDEDDSEWDSEDEDDSEWDSEDEETEDESEDEDSGWGDEEEARGAEALSIIDASQEPEPAEAETDGDATKDDSEQGTSDESDYDEQEGEFNGVPPEYAPDETQGTDGQPEVVEPFTEEYETPAEQDSQDEPIIIPAEDIDTLSTEAESPTEDVERIMPAHESESERLYSAQEILTMLTTGEGLPDEIKDDLIRHYAERDMAITKPEEPVQTPQRIEVGTEEQAVAEPEPVKEEPKPKRRYLRKKTDDATQEAESPKKRGRASSGSTRRSGRKTKGAE